VNSVKNCSAKEQIVCKAMQTNSLQTLDLQMYSLWHASCVTDNQLGGNPSLPNIPVDFGKSNNQSIKGAKMKGQKGFSLVELLVVIIIIGIIAAIAIPNLLSTLGAANEKAAVGTLRTIHSAQTTYLSRNGQYAADLTALNGAGLLDGLEEGGTKSGYVFTSEVGTGKYCAVATPENEDEKTFGVNTSGTLYEGEVTCSAGELSGGTVSGS